jgi:hypothetical protein
MKTLTQSVVALFVIFALFLSTACGTKPQPITTKAQFDQDAYVSIISAGTALNGFKSAPAVYVDLYKTQVNQAGASYNAFVEVYKVYLDGTGGDIASIGLELGTLTSDIAVLVADFSDPIMPAKAAADMKTKLSAAKTKREAAFKAGTAVSANISFQEVIAILSIVAGYAKIYPPAAPYAELASFVLQLISQVQGAVKAGGSTIDVSKIPVFTPIP